MFILIYFTNLLNKNCYRNPWVGGSLISRPRTRGAQHGAVVHISITKLHKLVSPAQTDKCWQSYALWQLKVSMTQNRSAKCKWQGPLTLAIIYHLWCMGTRDRRAMNRGLWIMNGRLVLPLLVFMWFARLYILDWALVRRGASVICSNGKWIIIVLNTSFRTLCITDHVLA